jgi:ParB family transcriptional regulator, chromosome partitioning protein
MTDEVKMIPIAEIHVLNPRQRDKKKFELIVQSIQNLGLKMPITVSLRADDEPAGLKYDLVCGQGRMEAYIALGHKEIPAKVVEISKEERLIRSLVENIARRYPSPMDLIREIERLRGLGYNNLQIGVKLDVSGSTVNSMMALRKAGEERLLHAALAGKIPLWVAVEIAKADTPEMQRDLRKAFENKELNYLDIRKAKRLMDKRRLLGKQKGDGPRSSRTSLERIIATYRQETQRQKLMIKQSRVCDARLFNVVTAFNKLLADAHFLTLLRAEALDTMPKFLWAKLTPPTPVTT